MDIVLVILAGLIFIVYSSYFMKIITGDPSFFEVEMLKALAGWIISKGTISKIYIWVMVLSSILAEALYFWLTLVLISNPIMRSLTILLIAIEIYHFSKLALNLNRFFNGKDLLSQVFDWRLERTSAIFFFTHSFLVIVGRYFF
ncbi:MAG: hypothetical protein PHF24_00700 [Syntrophomonas sp.]|nr:hypothetical protein [Syntrophomonas sp.]